jgi:hypothetical protein
MVDFDTLDQQPTAMCTQVKVWLSRTVASLSSKLDALRRSYDIFLRILTITSWACFGVTTIMLFTSYTKTHLKRIGRMAEHNSTQGFYIICVLAIVFRYADKSRPDMDRISISQYESTLHREAKYMLDAELERPGGVPLVVALLLLGDMECQVGRDNTGWLYGGMAVR